MKIAHIVLKGRLSGAEILVAQIAPVQVAHGHSVEVFSIETSEPSFRPFVDSMVSAGVVWHEIGGTGRLSQAWRLFRALNSSGPAVVFAHSIIPSALARMYRLHARQSTFATMLHSACQDDYNNRRWWFLERWCLPRPDLLLAVTSRALWNYRRRVGDVAAALRVNNCVDIRRFERSPHGGEPGHCRIVHLARYQKYKNHTFSINLAAALQSRYPHIKVTLLLAGADEDHQYKKELERKCHSCGIDATVSGPISNVHEILASAQISVIPSYYELMSLALLESLASGVFIVAASIDTFRFAERFPGVMLTSPEAVDPAIEKMRPEMWQRRYYREMEEYSAEAVALSHLSGVKAVQGEVMEPIK